MSLLRSIRRVGLASRTDVARYWSRAHPSRGEGLAIDMAGRDRAFFPFVWLRDSCLSPSCIHPSTSQKLHRSSDIPVDIRPAEGGVSLTDDGLRIRWADGHDSFFPPEFLWRHASLENLAEFHKDVEKRPWDGAKISSNPNLFVSYASLQQPSGLLAAIDQLCADGLLFVTGVPHTDTAEATCELRKLASTFSQIRETFYGQVWDVVNMPDSINIAYTNLDLGLHMDLLHFKHPPQYQILHCLRNRVHGGTSRFVDALHAATWLGARDAPAFALLADTPVPFHYINNGHHLHCAHPTLERGPGGAIAHINYSPPFQAPLRLDTPRAFYDALAAFARALDDPARTYEYTLAEGDAVIFDNRRVLHARTAFHDKEGAEEKTGEPNRWLKGCYFEADGLLDRGRMLRKRPPFIPSSLRLL
ncbi:hypothetical protein DFH07DRAFT_902679 [Mycena maculata]|uniref:Clavaminate synthase-like protein n=1 Tax=Mycena maculata TaxID=230809 RepID=A0AAD7NLL9_9AGAR|nr:hypothetical protein DFH07DRAFT_902679 [Mycena maculata]